MPDLGDQMERKYLDEIAETFPFDGILLVHEFFYLWIFSRFIVIAVFWMKDWATPFRFRP